MVWVEQVTLLHHLTEVLQELRHPVGSTALLQLQGWNTHCPGGRAPQEPQHPHSTAPCCCTRLHSEPKHVPGMQRSAAAPPGVPRATSSQHSARHLGCCKCRGDGLRFPLLPGDKGLCTHMHQTTRTSAPSPVGCCRCENRYAVHTCMCVHTRRHVCMHVYICACPCVCTCAGPRRVQQECDSRGVGVLQEAKLITLAIGTQGLHDRQDPSRGEWGRRVESWSQ